MHNYKMGVLRKTTEKTFTKKQMYDCATFFTLTHYKKNTRSEKTYILKVALDEQQFEKA